MGTLLDLIAGLAPTPAATATPRIAITSAPADNDPHQSASEQSKVPVPAPVERAPDATSEQRRAAWPIFRGGKSIGYMVGPPIAYAEALAEARWRWPDATVEKCGLRPARMGEC